MLIFLHRIFRLITMVQRTTQLTTVCPKLNISVKTIYSYNLHIFIELLSNFYQFISHCQSWFQKVHLKTVTQKKLLRNSTTTSQRSFEEE